MNLKNFGILFLVVFGVAAATHTGLAAPKSLFKGDNLYDFYARAMPQALRGYAADHKGLFPLPKAITGDAATDALLKGGYLPEYFENPLAPGSRVKPQPLAEQTPGNFTYFWGALPSSYAIVVLKGDTPRGGIYSALAPDLVTPWAVHVESNPNVSEDITGRMMRAVVLASMVYSDTGRFNPEALENELLDLMPDELAKARNLQTLPADVAAKARLDRGVLVASVYAAGNPDAVLFGFTAPDFAGFHRQYAQWAPAETARANTHTVQIALELYATDNTGYYPANLSVLLDRGFLLHLPVNSYDPPNLMQVVAPGQLSTGNIVYVPLYTLYQIQGGGPTHVISGYFLGLIGPENAKGTKVNPRIILWYTAGVEMNGPGGRLPEIKTWDDVLREYARAQTLAPVATGK